MEMHLDQPRVIGVSIFPAGNVGRVVKVPSSVILIGRPSMEVMTGRSDRMTMVAGRHLSDVASSLETVFGLWRWM